MSLSAIRDEYRVPARLGARVSARYPLIDDDGYLTPISGTITGADGDLIVVTPDTNCAWQHVFRAHPSRLTFHPTTEEN